MAKPATFFANFPVNKHQSTSEVICRCRSTYEGCYLVPLVTSSFGDSELLTHFQEAYARLFPHCYNKQGIQSDLRSYTPVNQGATCSKVYPEGIQPSKGNNWTDSYHSCSQSIVLGFSDIFRAIHIRITLKILRVVRNASMFLLIYRTNSMYWDR